jgi:hypothetical protein
LQAAVEPLELEAFGEQIGLVVSDLAAEFLDIDSVQ